MPRYYRRRYTRTLAKPKKKWASNILTLNSQTVSPPFAVTLVQNSQQSANPTPVVIKTGNFKISLDCHFDFGSTAQNTAVVQVFILYVPEGWVQANIPQIVGSHPEWIMASKTVGGSYEQSSIFSLETLNMSTRLKRNLNSGDGIVLLFVPNVAPQGSSLEVTGHVRYWTCAN